MMNDEYHQTLSKLEKDNVSRDYMIGWASGYLGNPRLEEQRVTEHWSAGYEDGSDKHTNNAESCKKAN